jgi:hypothetical protein
MDVFHQISVIKLMNYWAIFIYKKPMDWMSLQNCYYKFNIFWNVAWWWSWNVAWWRFGNNQKINSNFLYKIFLHSCSKSLTFWLLKCNKILAHTFNIREFKIFLNVQKSAKNLCFFVFFYVFVNFCYEIVVNFLPVDSIYVVL